jgi:Phospholipase_D-nuclease N-terminal
MENIMKYLPLLAPVFLLQISLLVIALLDLLRRQKTRGPKWAWGLAILFVQMIGPILYLVLGREEE